MFDSAAERDGLVPLCHFDGERVTAQRDVRACQLTSNKHYNDHVCWTPEADYECDIHP